MTNRSSTTSTEATTVTTAAAAAAPASVLSVSGGRDHRRHHETGCRDTKTDCEHGNLSARPGRLIQRADAFLVHSPKLDRSPK
jgi:hypothetical protein